MRRVELSDFVTDDHMIKLEKHFENEFTRSHDQLGSNIYSI